MNTEKSSIAFTAMVEARLEFAHAVIAHHSMLRFDLPEEVFDNQNERIADLQITFEAAEGLYHLALESEDPESPPEPTPLKKALQEEAEAQQDVSDLLAIAEAAGDTETVEKIKAQAAEDRDQDDPIH